MFSDDSEELSDLNPSSSDDEAGSCRIRNKTRVCIYYGCWFITELCVVLCCAVVAKAPKQPAQSFLELAAQAAQGKWECARCFVLNKTGIAVCASCDTPNPNADPAQAAKSGDSVATGVSFGFGVVPVSSSDSAGASVTTSSQSGFSFGGATQTYSFGGNTVSFGSSGGFGTQAAIAPSSAVTFGTAVYFSVL